MKVLLLGATGATGRQLVDQLRAAGHAVTALVRDPATAELAGATVVKGRATDAAEVAASVAGQDAVVSALGPRDKRDPVCVDTARAVIAAMQQHGVKRLVWLSAGGVGDSAPQIVKASFVFGRIIMPLLMKHPYAHHAQAEALIRASDLDWTVVRPVQLVDKPTGGAITVVPIGGAKIGGLKISRHDVAAWMAAELTSRAQVGTMPVLHA